MSSQKTESRTDRKTWEVRGAWRSGAARCVLGMVVSMPASHVAAWAGDLVEFDVPRSIACRDVSTEEFVALNPRERLMEARVPVSTLLRTEERGLIEFLYRLDCRAYGEEIVDYAPKTTLETPLAGNVGVERRTEDSRNAGLSVAGDWDPLGKGTGSAGISTKEMNTVKYDLLPPMDAVAASGTMNRRSSVYFKLRPTPRASLEGAREFTVVLRVPKEWRGEYVVVRCQAIGHRRSAAPSLDDRGVLGDRTFSVALYGQGDAEAKAMAERFAESEWRMRRAAAVHRRQIEKQSFPTVAHKVGALFTVVEPKIPDGWLDELLRANPGAPIPEYTRYLPDAVRVAAREYTIAKRDLASLARVR
ncbi:MAG: hypothetical protein FJ297_10910 [Planctomycetes bacterium]|nr:hypothetical protein [Planctomycetota bacterium]